MTGDELPIPLMGRCHRASSTSNVAGNLASAEYPLPLGPRKRPQSPACTDRLTSKQSQNAKLFAFLVIGNLTSRDLAAMNLFSININNSIFNSRVGAGCIKLDDSK